MANDDGAHADHVENKKHEQERKLIAFSIKICPVESKIVHIEIQPSSSVLVLWFNLILAPLSA